MPLLVNNDGTLPEDLSNGFLLGEWTVSPLEGQLRRGDELQRIQPKAMDVLLVLASAAGQVVGREQLLHAVWGERAATDEPLTRCIGDLRRALGDQRDNPVHIQTIPKRGYRLLVPVRPPEQPPVKEPEKTIVPDLARRNQGLRIAVALLFLTVLIGFLLMSSDRLAGPVSEGRSAQADTGDPLPAIAVLPFLNLSADPTDAFMADGTAETVTHVLAHVDGLKVIARSSAFLFRGAEDVRVIGDVLGVDVVLEGSVQVLDENMRITAQLVTTDDGRHLWSASYDQPVQDLFSVQEQIAGDVARALQLTLLGDQTGMSDSSADFEAYREYLLGIERLQERTADSILAAERHFSRARELDETYALAHVGYAESISLQHYYNNRPIAEVKALAMPAIDKALSLDSSLGEAYATLGSILFNDGDYAGAEIAMQRALAMNPNNARAWFGYGTLYNDTGRPEKALDMHLRALELNPLAPHINTAVGVAYEKLGEFDKAEAQFQRTLEIAPDYGSARSRLAFLDWDVKGDAEAAIRLYEEAITADPGNPWAPAMMARMLLDLGDIERAHAALSSAEPAPQGVVTGEILALLMTREGFPPEQRLALVEPFFDEVKQFGFKSRLLRIARDAYLEMGHPDTAIALLQRAHPELFTSPITVDWVNFSSAIDIAYVLQLTGEQAEADTLLDAVETFINTIPRLGCCGFGVTDVEIATLRGNPDLAVKLLDNAVEEGWKTDWWLETLYNPNLASLAGHPHYVAILDAMVMAMERRLEGISLRTP